MCMGLGLCCRGRAGSCRDPWGRSSGWRGSEIEKSPSAPNDASQKVIKPILHLSWCCSWAFHCFRAQAGLGGPAGPSLWLSLLAPTPSTLKGQSFPRKGWLWSISLHLMLFLHHGLFPKPCRAINALVGKANLGCSGVTC